MTPPPDQDPAPDPETTPDLTAKPAPSELWARPFLGLEIYHMDKAEWNLYLDPQNGKMNFWICVYCDRAIHQFQDTADTGVIPSWELNGVEPEIEISPGFQVHIPAGFDETRDGWITNFYANSYEGTDNNTLTVLQQDGDRLLLRLTGETTDLNFYDGSKPKTVLTVESWFVKNEKGGRSMQ